MLAIAVGAALIAATVGAQTASARGLVTGFSDNNIFDPSAQTTATRGVWLDRAVGAGAGIIRISVDWRNMVRNKPKNPINPDDPAYGFVRLDKAVRAAKARGLEVLLTVYRAPSWAEGTNPPPGIQPGAWKPNPVAYGKFGQALARRYSGNFHGLPRVRYFEAWSEPNLTQFLAPQWQGTTPFAPRLYRQLLNHFYLGVHAAQPGATVIGGATSAFGDSRTHQLNPAQPRMRPVAFLRTVLCLNTKLRRAPGCTSKSYLDAVSAHPINNENGPHYVPHNKDNIQVASFKRIRNVVSAANRAKTLGHVGPKPLWVTESGMLSNPPNPLGASPKTHAHWIEEALYLLWKQGASVVLNLNIRDPAYDRNHVPSGQWTTGIYTHGGAPKPALKAFRFPFVTHRKSKTKVSAWGRSVVGGTLTIQQRLHGHWRTRKRLNVSAGQVFTTKFRLRGKATLRAQVKQTRSLAWYQPG